MHNYNYKLERPFAIAIALVFLATTSANPVEAPIATAVKVLTPKDKRKKSEDEDMEYERITHKQLRVGLERYMVKMAPIKARKDSMKRRLQRKIEKIRKEARQEGIAMEYSLR